MTAAIESKLIAWTATGGTAMRTNVLVRGKPRATAVPLVLLHGVGMDHSFWQPQIAHFSVSRPVVAYDMLGHGKSSPPPAQPDLGNYAEQIDALLDHLALPAIDLVGHSMGSLISIEYALRRPDRVRRLAALNAVYCRTAEQRAAVEQRAAALEASDDPTAGIDQTLGRWFGDPVPEAMKEAAETARTLLRRVNHAGYSRTYGLFARSDRHHLGKLDRLTMPALFMTGEFDYNSAPSMSEAMAAAAPLGKAIVVKGQRHLMTLAAPETINRNLDDFFGAKN